MRMQKNEGRQEERRTDQEQVLFLSVLIAAVGLFCVLAAMVVFRPL